MNGTGLGGRVGDTVDNKCKWVWLGDEWSQLQSCTSGDCAMPPTDGTYTGQEVFTDCM